MCGFGCSHFWFRLSCVGIEMHGAPAKGGAEAAAVAARSVSVILHSIVSATQRAMHCASLPLEAYRA
jgi:hypothetical protein